jgi:hypothetical protein
MNEIFMGKLMEGSRIKKLSNTSKKLLTCNLMALMADANI